MGDISISPSGAKFEVKEDGSILRLGQISTIDECMLYLKLYPNDPFAKHAQDLLTQLQEEEKAEEISLWNYATSVDTIASYRKYILFSKLKLYLDEAKSKLETRLWTWATALNTLYAYQEYLRLSLLKVHQDEALKIIEYELWLETCNSNSINAYQMYLKESPLQSHRNEAIESIESLLWERACNSNSIDAYKKYIKASKLKTHKDEAIEIIENLLWKSACNSNSIGEYEEYIKTSKLKAHIDEAENRIWKQSHFFWDGYYNYLDVFPMGKYVNQIHLRKILIAIIPHILLWTIGILLSTNCQMEELWAFFLFLCLSAMYMGVYALIEITRAEGGSTCGFVVIFLLTLGAFCGASAIISILVST